MAIQINRDILQSAREHLRDFGDRSSAFVDAYDTHTGHDTQVQVFYSAREDRLYGADNRWLDEDTFVRTTPTHSEAQFSAAPPAPVRSAEPTRAYSTYSLEPMQPIVAPRYARPTTGSLADEFREDRSQMILPRGREITFESLEQDPRTRGDVVAPRHRDRRYLSEAPRPEQRGDRGQQRLGIATGHRVSRLSDHGKLDRWARLLPGNNLDWDGKRRR